jgi:UDP-N-acetylglucosamine acyltransferase
VVQDVPPFMLADGNPARSRTVNKVGLERNGFSDEVQQSLKKAYKILFRSGLTTKNAVDQIEKELPDNAEIQHLVEFMRASQRGVA